MKKAVDATLPTHANPDDVILFYILNLSSAAKVKFYFFYMFFCINYCAKWRSWYVHLTNYAECR